MLYLWFAFAKLLLSPALSYCCLNWSEVLFSSGAYFHSCDGGGKCHKILRGQFGPQI